MVLEPEDSILEELWMLEVRSKRHLKLLLLLRFRIFRVNSAFLRP